MTYATRRKLGMAVGLFAAAIGLAAYSYSDAQPGTPAYKDWEFLRGALFLLVCVAGFAWYRIWRCPRCNAYPGPGRRQICKGCGLSLAEADAGDSGDPRALAEARAQTLSQFPNLRNRPVSLAGPVATLLKIERIERQTTRIAIAAGLAGGLALAVWLRESPIVFFLMGAVIFGGGIFVGMDHLILLPWRAWVRIVKMRCPTCSARLMTTIVAGPLLIDSDALPANCGACGQPLEYGDLGGGRARP